MSSDHFKLSISLAEDMAPKCQQMSTLQTQCVIYMYHAGFSKKGIGKEFLWYSLELYTEQKGLVL